MSMSSLTLTPHSNIDATFPVSVRNFSLRLPSFASSGFSWFVMRNPAVNEGWNVVYRGRDNSNCPSNMVGCSGTEIFTLHLTQAPRPGQVISVPFVSARPFDVASSLINPTSYVYRLRFQGGNVPCCQ